MWWAPGDPRSQVQRERAVKEWAAAARLPDANLLKLQQGFMQRRVVGHPEDAPLAGFYQSQELVKGTYKTVGIVRQETVGRVHICLPLCDPIDLAHMSVEVVDGRPRIVVTVDHHTNRDVRPPLFRRCWLGRRPTRLSRWRVSL